MAPQRPLWSFPRRAHIADTERCSKLGIDDHHGIKLSSEEAAESEKGKADEITSLFTEQSVS